MRIRPTHTHMHAPVNTQTRTQRSTHINTHTRSHTRMHTHISNANDCRYSQMRLSETNAYALCCKHAWMHPNTSSTTYNVPHTHTYFYYTTYTHVCHCLRTLYDVHYRYFIVRRTLYDVHTRISLYAVYCTTYTRISLYAVHCITPYTVRRTVYVVLCTLYSVRSYAI